MPPRAKGEASRSSVTLVSPRRLGVIRSRLLTWYDAHLQDFPWRTARDPYLALVAAVCAQQTQMSRVLPAYQRWIEAFPTLEAAAGASTAEALRAWARNGYPRRAIALRDAARICLERHDGALPRDPEALRALPGVGPFTAAIVLCFGYGDDAAAVDTNVVRLIGRLVLGDLQPAAESSPAVIEAWARRLLPRGEAARWNPALMDYGGSVCTPRPRCEACVVASLCVARPRFAAGERATPVRAQPPFEGSDRQWRGRILRELRRAHAPVEVPALLARLPTSEGGAERAAALLLVLAAEGMAWLENGWCGLGDAPPPRPPRSQRRGLAAARYVEPLERHMRGEGAAVALSEQVYVDDTIAIVALKGLGPMSNNAYIIRPLAGGPVLVVDAPEGSEAVIEALGDDAVERVILTHSHRDHWGGHDLLRIRAPFAAGEHEVNLDTVEAGGAVERLADGASLTLGRPEARPITTGAGAREGARHAQVQVIATPGHTPGSICLLAGRALLSGDTLFPGGPGYSRSSEALLQEIESITTRLHSLPDDTLVLPGHGEATTIGASKAEYALFASKSHPQDLHGDVLWAES